MEANNLDQEGMSDQYPEETQFVCDGASNKDETVIPKKIGIEREPSVDGVNSGGASRRELLRSSLTFEEEILPSPDEQREEITELLKCPLINGHFWYLIDVDWFKLWKRFTGFIDENEIMSGIKLYGQKSVDSELCPINNSNLLNQEGELKQNLAENFDYKIVPENVWLRLVNWYGLVDELHVIQRQVIQIGGEKELKVEIYEMDIHVFLRSRREEIFKISISRAETMQVLKNKIKATFDIPGQLDIRLYTKKDGYQMVNENKPCVLEAGVKEGQHVMVEAQNENKKWPKTVQIQQH